MRESDGPAKVYNHEDLRRLIKGSERANQMKREISLVLNVLIGVIEKFTPKRFLPPMEDVFSARILLHECEYSLIVHESLSITKPRHALEVRIDRNGKMIFFDIANRINELPLNYIKAIYDALPDLLTQASLRFLEVETKLEELDSFADF